MNPKIDAFFTKESKWQKEYQQLRKIVLECGLVEDYKWMHPCYQYQSNNIVLIHGFKDYCALLFHKGALLSDESGILIQQTENVQSARQIRFTNLSEIERLEATIKAYTFEAIEIEEAGLKVDFKKTAQYDLPEELQLKFNESTELKAAFESLTPGRQRGYLLHFSKPKQSKTRVSRIEKSLEKILNGKGLNDQ